MYAQMFRPCLIAVLLLMAVPAAGMVEGLLGGRQDPSYVGAAVLSFAIVAVLCLVLIGGHRRPGLTMSVLGGCGVMVVATSWVFGDPSELLLNLAAVVMFGVTLWAAVTKLDRMKDVTQSHFR